MANDQAPWEKYATKPQGQSSDSGPWARYATGTDQDTSQLRSPILGRNLTEPPINLTTLMSLPLGIESFLAAPIKTLGAVASGYLTGKGTRLAANKLGASEGVQDWAEVGGNLAGGLVGGLGADKLTPGLRNLRFTPEAAPELTESQKLQASIDKAMARRAGLKAAKVQVEGTPAESLAKSPNYPRIAAARTLARQDALESLQTKAQTGSAPRISKAGVLRVPEPREALPTDTPGYLSSIPRERLPGLAMQGYPGAGELLRTLGKQVIYMPPEGYPGPRLQLPKPLMLPRTYDLAAD